MPLLYLWRWPCRAPSAPRHAPLRINVVSMFFVVYLRFTACCACLETPSKTTFAELFVDDSLVLVRFVCVAYHALDALHACVFRQVLLAGGAISSPQVLMLSGVGPEQHLKSKVQCSQRLAFVQGRTPCPFRTGMVVGTFRAFLRVVCLGFLLLCGNVL